MDEYTEKTYGDRIAEIYDLRYGAHDPLAVSTLRDLARGGMALELGIGTGRIALPLHEQGIRVSGIDASEAMIAKLRSKPGGKSIPVTIGDFADVDVGVDVEGAKRFSLVYVVFNTFFALLTQDAQLKCFANVARHLDTDGRFVAEAFMPDLARFKGRQEVRAIDIGTDEVGLDVTQVDPAEQLITGQHLEMSPHGTKFYPVRLRYAWPSEMDLMARLGGLRLAERWSSWSRAPFSAGSTNHISLYRLAS